MKEGGLERPGREHGPPHASSFFLLASPHSPGQAIDDLAIVQLITGVDVIEMKKIQTFRCHCGL